MEKTLKVGIIGCGGIANGKHMPALSRNPHVKMVAFCDLVAERAEEAAGKFGEEGALVCTDYKELLKDAAIDVVHVLTPNREHSFITVDALEAGKHVCCEKPMAKTYAEAVEMCEAAKRTGKKLTIGYQNRWRANSMALKAVCEADELGEVYYARALARRRRALPTWGVFQDKEEQGGGSLIDIGTHALDLTLWTMNNYEPKMVVGKAFFKLGKQTNTGNAWGDWDPDTLNVEDSAFGYIVMKNGAIISLETSWALNTLDVREACVELCGTKAGADFGNGEELRINGVRHGRQYVENISVGAGGVAFFDGAAATAEDVECAKWVTAILNDTEVETKPEQALVVTQILEAIYQSSETGQPVYFD